MHFKAPMSKAVYTKDFCNVAGITLDVYENGFTNTAPAILTS